MEKFGGVCERAKAKINLSLSVISSSTGKMHILDSVMAEIPLCDDLFVASRPDKDVTVSYFDGRRYPRDNVERAARAVVERYDVNGVDVMIRKHIPEGAGLGGSAADAAAVVRAMRAIYGLTEIDPKLLLSIGSDVPFMFRGGVARVKGFGEKITAISSMPFISGTVAFFDGLKLSTSEVFSHYDRMSSGKTSDISDFLGRGMKAPVNDLEEAAISLEPKIAELRNYLLDLGYPNVVMTGSGAAFIGYKTQRVATNGKSGATAGAVLQDNGIVTVDFTLEG